METNKKLSRENISRVFETSELIASLDKNDPHYLLKIQNILKGYSHHIIAKENEMALDRTNNLTSVTKFREFLEERKKKHGYAAGNWFSAEMDAWKLKHFYLGSEKPKECTSPGKECECWKIE